jgi:hypothetical protein
MTQKKRLKSSTLHTKISHWGADVETPQLKVPKSEKRKKKTS